jgi:glycosyltransferase involved in cell wall biosynthesis
MWLLRFLLVQLQISSHLLRLSRNIDVVVYRLGPPGLLPTLVAKALRKRLITVVAVSEARVANIEYDRRSLSARAIGVMERTTLALADHIVAANRSVAVDVGIGRYSQKTHYAYPQYVNTEAFRVEKRLAERGPVVGFVGRLWRSKGVLHLAAAIPLILKARPEARFIFVGDGPAAAEAREQLERKGCLDKVEFAGWVPYHQLPGYLNRMRFHILPSFIDTVGFANLEAMACGAIAIASAVGGVPEFVRDGETGFLLPDVTPQSIADKVLEVWDSPHLEEIQHRAHALIEEAFCYERAVERWGRLLGSV